MTLHLLLIFKTFFIYLFSAQSFQQYLGTYDRQEAKNYLEFLDDLGLNKLLKKAATASNPVLEVNYDEETKIWSFKTCTKITCNNLNFKIGEEYNRKTKDGREVIIKAIKKGNAIILKQTNLDYSKASVFTVYGSENIPVA